MQTADYVKLLKYYVDKSNHFLGRLIKAKTPALLLSLMLNVRVERKKKMGAPYTGGCQCGRIRYEIKAEPLTLYACHCQECQKQSSSTFRMSMPVLREAVVIILGHPKEWTRKSESGREVTCLFCEDCGTRLFHNPAYNQKITNVKPGTLDKTDWIQPVGNLWTRRAQQWVHIPEHMLNYEGQPDDFLQLFERWKTCTS